MREILPNGVRDGHEWRCGSLAGEKGQSLAVHLAAPRAGVWKDFAGTDTGDALDLVAQVLFAGDKVASIKWAKGWLGLDGTNPEALRQTRRAVAAKNEDPDAEADIKKRRANSLRIFLSATAELTGTPVESYLAGRGLDIHELPYPPGAIRYHGRTLQRRNQASTPGHGGADHQRGGAAYRGASHLVAARRRRRLGKARGREGSEKDPGALSRRVHSAVEGHHDRPRDGGNPQKTRRCRAARRPCGWTSRKESRTG